MGQLDSERLSRLLGDPELAWVVDRARRRLELGQPLRGSIERRGATPAERNSVARLFGRARRAGQGLSVSLEDLDTLLRRSGAHSGGLAAAVIELTGPVTIRADAAADDLRAWTNAFAPIEATAAAHPELSPWIDGVRASGLVKRLVGGSAGAGRELLEVLASVIVALPLDDGEALSAFAARVTGRAHALDDGSPLSTLALGASRALAGLEPPDAGESAVEARRETWAAVGVLCDDLSSTVLTLGLPGDATATGQVLAAADLSGEPVWLTLRQLVRAPPRWQGVDAVLVVENPSVVAIAADRLGAHRQPIICTNGQPCAATMVLLRSLAAAGVRLRHHGDFDWGGLVIGNVLHRRLPVEAWQFDRDAYLSAAAAHPHAAALTGSPASAIWDSGLADAMEHVGRRIEEELVADRLLESL